MQLPRRNLYRASIESFTHTECNLDSVRFPEKVEIAYGPKGVKPPDVKPLPLYRTPATVAERKKLLQAVEELEPSPAKKSVAPGLKKYGRSS